MLASGSGSQILLKQNIEQDRTPTLYTISQNKGRGKLLALLYLVVHFPRISDFMPSAIKNVVKREVN